MADIAVIGAGMGGMAAAARLATKGHSVSVYEHSDRAGGKNRGLSRDGFVFDLGPSTFTLPAVYRDLFLKTGKALEDSVDLIGVDPAFAYHFPPSPGTPGGATASVPGAGIGAAASAFQEAFGGDAGAQWRALMQRAAEVWALTRSAVLGSPVDGFRSMLPLARSPKDLRTVAPWQTLRQLGGSALTDPHLQQILDRYATYTGSDPRRCPAALVTIPYVEQAFGVWHVRGGVHRLADALWQRCCERGVEFHFGVDVDSILTGEDGVRGLRTTAGEIRADYVICNSDARSLYGSMLQDDRADSARKRLRRMQPSFSGFVLLLAVSGRTPGLHHHNVWFCEDYDAEFDALWSHEPVADPTIYACVPDDDTMHPPDHEAWFVLINAPVHDPEAGMDWDAAGSRYADHILDVLARRGTDLRERLLWREIITPADLERDTLSPGGSIYGLSSNGRLTTALRPANRSPVPGLYLVGGSAHPGGGLPLVGMSGEIVSDLIGRP